MINIHISECNYDTWTYCSARCNVSSEPIRLAFSEKKNLNLSHVPPPLHYGKQEMVLLIQHKKQTDDLKGL